MNTKLQPAIIALMTVILLGCETVSGTRGGDTDSDTDRSRVCADFSATRDENGSIIVFAADRFNYRFSSELSVSTVNVRPGVDLTFDWSDVSVDLLGQEMDPLTGVDMLQVSLWQYSKDALIQDINNDTLDRGRLVVLGKAMTKNSASSINYLNLLSPSGAPLKEEALLEYTNTNKYPLDEYSYLIMAAEGHIIGKGTKLLSFFDPIPNETNTEIRLTDSSTQLDCAADMSSLDRISIPPRDSNIILSWEDDTVLRKNAMGGDWIPTKISNVIVAQYLGRTPEELEQDFLDLERIADKMYTTFLSTGQEIHFDRLRNEKDEAFQGIDEHGTWIVALKCGLYCENPAPWFLSILQPCG